METREPESVETSSLIASDKVEGTSVINRDGHKIGRILNFMVNKQSGKVEYAVMSFGGFFGMGEEHYPIPWNQLDYDVEQRGFVVDIEKEKLANGPKYSAGSSPLYDPAYLSSYYGMGF